MNTFKEILAKIADGEKLNEKEAESAFEIIMSGETTPAQTGAFLMALRVRGETVEEITGAARIMRAKALSIKAPINAVDTCGTGGDASGTYNISTGAAIVAASCEVPVAKHGNKAMSSKSGSSDILTALGVNINADMTQVEKSLKEANICFLMAPRHHSSMKHVAAARGELGTRTIFNLLGPLASPAGIRRQVMGVFDLKWIEPIANVLGKLGAEKAWVIHGSDGLDEITTTGNSYVAEYKNGQVKTFEINPVELGIKLVKPAELKGGDSTVNAKALREVFNGKKCPLRDIVAINAAAALVVADKVDTLKEGLEIAFKAIDDGKTAKTLDAMIAISNG